MSLFDLPADSGGEPARKARPEASSKTPAKATGRMPGRGRTSGVPGEKAPARSAEREVISVSGLTARISGSLSALGAVAVEGEVSASKRAGSGHWYFQLKDERANVSCAIWRSRVGQALKFDLEDGQQVVCHGRLDVYAPRGSYSLIVERVERRGLGEMLARLEKLKEELRKKGWFDRKRPIPTRPARIGLVTSRDADALRDFLRTRTLRWAGYPVRLCHTRVQGPGAANEIARAIGRLDDGGVDLICVVRGGGSLEDLWAFNELPVATAVWEASVPVISGVGHESDTTLIDYVADLRAHTPTHAAERAIPDRTALMERLERAKAYLDAAIERHIAVRERNWKRLAERPSLASADGWLRAPILALDQWQQRMARAMQVRMERYRSHLEQLNVRFGAASPLQRLGQLEERLKGLAPRLQRSIQQRLERAERSLKERERVLEAVSPLAVLGRGYALVERVEDGTLVRSSTEVEAGESVQVTLGSGRLAAKVQSTEDGAGLSSRTQPKRPNSKGPSPKNTEGKRAAARAHKPKSEDGPA